MKTLNITNGDGAANIIRQSTVPGDVLPWRDPMHHGPFPAARPLSDLSVIRAQYLAGPDADPTKIEQDFRLRDECLKASGDYDNVILWFEHDLLDQIQILQILDWFAGAKLDATRLEIICINSFPGVRDFRGIGQLDVDQMASLLKERQPVSARALALAQSAWATFRTADPNDLVRLLDTDLSALPFLATALRRHFEEFPDATTGLSRTEAQLLRLIGEGVQTPDQLFVKNMEMETALFIGDWPTYRIIEALCTAGLAACDPAPFAYQTFSPQDRSAFRAQRLSLTDTGRRVLDHAQDAFGLMSRDGWLGGVALTSSDSTWTWDKNAVAFMRRAG